MRKQTIEQIMIDADMLAGNDAGERALDVWVQTHGVKAAAWLMWKYRRQVREYGMVTFWLTNGQKLPVWYQVAVRYLQVYAGAKWDVSTGEEPGGRIWQIEWRGDYKHRCL